MTRAELGDAMRAAVRHHCHYTQAPEGHYEQCLADVRQEPAEDWLFWLSYFRGEVK